MSLDLEELREDYQLGELKESEIAADPFKQFAEWFEVAQHSQLPEPNAMILATTTKEGKPSARVMLLKEVNSRGFVFYSNYESRKGKELQQNPHAAIVFNWLELQRQVRIEGHVERLDEQESTEYFQSRPKGSQIGAWTSPQSQVIPDRRVLDARVEELTEKYRDTEVLPKPESWGGFIVIPEAVEFWQGRSSRLHDRIRYRISGEGWKIDRLAP